MHAASMSARVSKILNGDLVLFEGVLHCPDGIDRTVHEIETGSLA